jgi:hypothetical protein
MPIVADGTTTTDGREPTFKVSILDNFDIGGGHRARRNESGTEDHDQDQGKRNDPSSAVHDE